ncbi:flagellar basal-body MS-ring/collar protein FliF [Savagea faecisuis]|uniref:Flagellar M-ring protein n=1 Tax=Savagea faecisuis TaxID=1274803 RepID=A0ABW3GYF5_9BACL
MKERVAKIRADVSEFWSKRSKTQKIVYVSSALGIILVAALLTFFLSRTEYVPLYKDVSRAEVGRMKEHLDSLNVPNEIAPGGTSILVPKERVNELLVMLESEGFPNSGTIDYSFFADNAGFGTTDNEFNMLKVATLQTELANLIKGIEGVQDASVMLTLPTPSVFVRDVNEDATAAIMLKTSPGHEFTEGQIRAMYSLVSKSLPNLDVENITIMNQFSEIYDQVDPDKNTGAQLADQMGVKKSIERDIQRQVQQMLGLMMGHDKVAVSVSTEVDFKAENREENIVTPVDEENMEGIAMSAQRITETFTGNGPFAEGDVEGGDPTDNMTNTYGAWGFSNGDYERFEETINNEVNRVRKEIVESPYKVRDIGIQVIIDPPRDEEGEVTELPQNLQDDVEQILTTIVRTSIHKEDNVELTDEVLAEKIAVSIQPFNGSMASQFDGTETEIPLWVYIVGAILLVVIIVLVVLFLRKRKREQEELEEQQLALEEQEELMVDDINDEQETEATVRRKQLEKMAKEKPEEFAKLLRTWISED